MFSADERIPLALVAASPTASAATFLFSGAVVDFTIPVAGTYQITAFGAQGGSSKDNATLVHGGGAGAGLGFNAQGGYGGQTSTDGSDGYGRLGKRGPGGGGGGSFDGGTNAFLEGNISAGNGEVLITEIGGAGAPTVPEFMTWAMMATGFAALGLADLRRRRKA